MARSVETDFGELTRRTQVVRLARVARAATPQYLAGPVSIEPMYHGMNAVFRVVDPKSGTKYVLRVHPAKWLPAAQVEDEMRWLQAMSSEAALPVPSPVPRLDGAGFVASVGGAVVGGARCCTLCRWMDGHAVSARLTLQQMHQGGELLARIHEHGRAYAPYPDGGSGRFDRPRLDYDGLFGHGGMFDPGEGISMLTDEHMSVVTPSLERVGAAMTALGVGPDAFGPIHGDFYFRNVLVRGGSLGMIDFDMAGWGHYCLDLAIPYWPGRLAGREREFLAAALAGYRSVRDFPEGQEQHLSAMLAARRVIDVYYVLARWDHPDMRAAFPGFVDWACAILRKWLDTGEII